MWDLHDTSDIVSIVYVAIVYRYYWSLTLTIAYRILSVRCVGSAFTKTVRLKWINFILFRKKTEHFRLNCLLEHNYLFATLSCFLSLSYLFLLFDSNFIRLKLRHIGDYVLTGNKHIFTHFCVYLCYRHARV